MTGLDRAAEAGHPALADLISDRLLHNTHSSC
jgi:hypothetical protein